MKVSVVVCTYSPDLYDHFVDAVESVLAQTYDDVDVVAVVDGNPSLYDRVVERYGDHDGVTVHLMEENVGVSVCRTEGAKLADGDVVAMLDDDAVADPEWIRELVDVYEETDAIAAGGRMAPDWVAGKPRFLPDEFYWLIGVTHRGFAEDGTEVRNTFASNISFDREIFLELGGFNENVGRKGDKQIQAIEGEFCSRMRDAYGKGVIYNADAVVYHKIFEFRTDPVWLMKRSFWQGYSKRVMEVLVPDSGGDKDAFLRDLLIEHVPRRIGQVLRRPSVSSISQLLMIFVLTGLVGFGYVYGHLKW